MAHSIGITLDAALPEPLYRQIVDQLVDRIRSGALPPGFRLPPTRSLADELDVHRNTVVRAFEELSTGGYVVSTVGRGTFVAELEELANRAPAPPTPDRPPLPWDSLISRTADGETLRRLTRLRRSVKRLDQVDMARMQPSKELMPIAAFRRCLDYVIRTRPGRALGYSQPEGVPMLRESIANSLGELGVPARPEDILVTTGSQQALDLLARVLVDPGDRFLTNGLTYGGMLSILAAAGARTLGVASDMDGPEMQSVARMAKGAKGFYLMPDCLNPTGRCITTERRHELVEWSHQSGVPLIEDDYGAELNLDGTTTPPAMRALDPEVIYLGTYSKKIAPALRVGFIVCPPGLMRYLVELKAAADLGSSALLQYALSEFLDRGELKAHLRRVLPIYRDRRDAVLEALEEHMPEGVTWNMPQVGVSMWIALPSRLDGESVFREAQREGALVTPGQLHRTDGGPEPGVRITFCYEESERLVLGVERLAKAIRTVMTQQPSSRRGNGTHAALTGI